MTRFFSPNVFTAQGKAGTDTPPARDTVALRRAVSEKQNPVQARFGRWYPRAVVYREWRQNRWLYGLACLLLIFPAVGQVDWYTSLDIGDRNLTFYWAVIVLLFGVLVMRLDRTGMRYALSGPTGRRDVLRIKAAFGVMAVFLSFTVPWLFSVLGNVSNSRPFGVWQPGMATVGVLVHALALSALFLTGLAAACTVGNAFLATVGALLASVVPVFLSSIVTFLFSYRFVGTSGVTNGHWVHLLTTCLQLLSPMLLFSFAHSGVNVSLFLLWFTVWGAGFWWLGARLWERVMVERLSETYFFSQLRQVVLGGIALLAALAVAGRIAGARNGLDYLVVLSMAFVGAFWVVHRLSSFITFRRAGERP